eukprot:570243-Rhodomonas_salina.2
MGGVHRLTETLCQYRPSWCQTLCRDRTQHSTIAMCRRERERERGLCDHVLITCWRGQVKAFAASVTQTYPKIDVLVNNAGTKSHALSHSRSSYDIRLRICCAMSWYRYNFSSCLLDYAATPVPGTKLRRCPAMSGTNTDSVCTRDCVDREST